MSKSHSRSIWFFVAAAIIPLVYSNATIDPALTLRAILLAALTVVVLIATRNRPLRTGPIFVVWSTYAALRVASIVLATNSGEAIYSATTIVLYAAWFFAVLQLTTKDLIPRVVQIIALLGFTVAAISLFQYLDIGFGFIPGWSIPYATMTTKNLMSSFLFLTLPATIWIIFSGSRRLSIFGLCTFAISLLVLVITQTRAVWVGVATSGFAAALMFLFSGTRSALWNRYKIGIRNIALVIVACVLATLVFNITPHYGSRTKTAYEKAESLVNYASDTSANMRLTVWKESLRMLRDHPMGVGAGNWKVIIPAYGLEHFPSNVQDGTYQWTEAHNDFISALCETGIAGGLAFLAIFVVAIGIAVRASRSKNIRNPEETILIILIGAWIWGYAVVSFFDFPNARVEHSMLFVIWLGLLAVLTRSEHHEKPVTATRDWKIVIRPLAFVLALAAFGLSLQRFIAEQQEKKILEARIEQNWDAVIDGCNKIYNPKLLSLDALSTPILYYKAEAEFMEGRYSEALQDNLAALRAHPNHLYTLNNIGSSYMKIGNFRNAEAFYSKALAISPHFQESLLNMSVIFFNRGAFDSALSYVVRCDTTQTGSRAQTVARAIRAKLSR